jgi:cobalt/nickel transport system permease protein
MADALLSPAVGGGVWAATGATLAWSARQLSRRLDDRKVPLMGVLGAFIFAAQMVNFTIPGTGSSGHLGGGMILAVLLGPHAAFLAMASILTVQAFFFADGGLLALGCNILNLGFIPAFIAYPLLFRPIAGRAPTPGRLTTASLLSAVVALQLGAFGVVLQTALSGISELPFRTFVMVMQPIHLGIGVVEGLVTAAVISFVWRARPEVLGTASPGQATGAGATRTALLGLAGAALLTGGILSWFASSNPDGLEWAIARVTGGRGPGAAAGVHDSLAAVQRKTSLLPGYGFRETGRAEGAPEATAAWPAPDAGTSLSGVAGGLITLLVAAGVGWLLRRKRPAA